MERITLGRKTVPAIVGLGLAATGQNTDSGRDCSHFRMRLLEQGLWGWRGIFGSVLPFTHTLLPLPGIRGTARGSPTGMLRCCHRRPHAPGEPFEPRTVSEGGDAPDALRGLVSLGAGNSPYGEFFFALSLLWMNWREDTVLI